MNIKQFIMGTMVAASLMGSALPVLASTTDTTTATNKNTYKLAHGNCENRFETLVEEGVISQETCDSILAYLEANPSSMNNNVNKPSTDDIAAKRAEKPERAAGMTGEKAERTADMTGKRTGAKADKTSDDLTGKAMKKNDGTAQGSRTNLFDKLLEANVISQADYDAIIAYCPNQA